ncbi:MAG: uroporphyrinogen decarboxylase family protein [Candidatus Humimicrobiaceae bacterium]
MNSKERVLTALEHKEPDKVPKLSSFTPEFANKLREYFKMDKILFNPHGGTEHSLEIKLGNDILLTGQGWANSYYQSLDECYTDEWNIKWKLVEYKTAYGNGRYTEVSSHPLAEDEAIDSYIAPDPTIEDRYKPSKELIDEYGNEFAIMGVIVCTIYETAWALRGLEKLMMDFVLNEELANRILDIPFNYHLTAGKKLVKLGVDIIWTGDDMGGQEGMLISPQLWRKYFKPRMAKLYSDLKSINPNLKIAYHSDGNIYPIIDDLVEIGLDILNPIQPKSMDPYYLKKRYGKNLSLWGTIDIQETLPFGTTQDVENEVKERIKNLAPNSGFIISPTHHVQIDTPLENFFTFWESIEKYGGYPIVIS